MNQTAVKAARWWRKQISTEDIYKYDPFEKRELDAIFNFLLQDKVDNDMLDQFEIILTEELTSLLKEKQKITLECRRYPCPLLEKCGNFAGFNGLSFPWNTYMIIDGDSIQVKDNASDEYYELV